MKYRTLIRIEHHYTDDYSDIVDAVIPAWSPEQVIRVRVPKIIEDRIVRYDQRRFHVQVNLAANSVTELNISDWEMD